jgi:hypothetical protein
MSLKSAVQHNQSLVIAAGFSLAAALSMIGCHLSQLQKAAIIETSEGIAQAVVQSKPIPWPAIGELVGVLLGSGLLVDNRRKDVVIKRLKLQNADQQKLITTIVTPTKRNSTTP